MEVTPFTTTRDAITTASFRESLDLFSGAHWHHERRAWSANLQVGAFGARHTAPSWSWALRFMGSPHDFDAAHWDHEPRAWSADLQVGAFGACHTAPGWSWALRFMERAGASFIFTNP